MIHFFSPILSDNFLFLFCLIDFAVEEEAYEEVEEEAQKDETEIQIDDVLLQPWFSFDSPF